MAPGKEAAPQPASWGELCNSYRSTWGAASFSSMHDKGAEVQQRFTRSVPTMCPLAETRHPLFATGEAPHRPNAADGSLHRTARHGWGDVSLLKHGGPAPPPERPSRAAAAPPPGKDGRSSLFGTLSGAEVGGTDSWIGNIMVDPTKGRRAVTPPKDPKGRQGLAEVLSLASPGKPDEDAWLGCPGIDPARGRGHAADPSAKAGRPNLFGVLQPDRPRGAWERGGVGIKEEADAWVGNRGIAPNTGKRAADESEVAAAQAHLWGAVFRGGPPADGCYSDMPRIGKRPLPNPVKSKGAVSAAHALRQLDALPPGTKPPGSDAKGKRISGEPPKHAAAVGVFSLLTYKDIAAPRTAPPPQQQTQTQSQEQQQQRAPGHGASAGARGGWAARWDDAAHVSRRKAAGAVPGARLPGDGGLLDWSPNRAARFVPHGGLAQERGMNVDTISKVAAITRKGGGTMAAKPKAAAHKKG